MHNELTTRTSTPPLLRNTLLLAALAAVYPVVAHAASATVEFASGTVSALSTSGTQRPLSKGASLLSGETISTGKDGRAQLRFSDGALMSLQPETEFRIDKYEYNGKPDGKEEGFFSLIKGGLRTITGLIGRNNKQAYKLNTSVATVGIRGTEYTVQFTGGTDGQLNVATGDGEIQVCNTGGCVFVSGGESAIVTGANSQPRRTDVRPILPPQARSRDIVLALREAEKNTLADGSLFPSVDYSIVESRTPTGGILPVGRPMLSGSGYTEAHVGLENGTLSTPNGTTVTAAFDPYSALQQFSNGTPYKAKQIASSFSMDGVVAWGLWSTGVKASGSGVALKNTHYVIGLPTPSMPSGGSATYALAGFTTPTSQSGFANALLGGKIDINFSTGFTGTVALTIASSTGTQTYNNSFSGSGTSATIGTGSLSGFLQIFGANASHAGLAYTANNGSEDVYGVAAFKR